MNDSLDPGTDRLAQPQATQELMESQSPSMWTGGKRGRARPFQSDRSPCPLRPVAGCVAALSSAVVDTRENAVCRGKAPFHSGCESRPATVVPAGSNRSGSWR